MYISTLYIFNVHKNTLHSFPLYLPLTEQFRYSIQFNSMAKHGLRFFRFRKNVIYNHKPLSASAQR